MPDDIINLTGASDGAMELNIALNHIVSVAEQVELHMDKLQKSVQLNANGIKDTEAAIAKLNSSMGSMSPDTYGKKLDQLQAKQEKFRQGLLESQIALQKFNPVYGANYNNQGAAGSTMPPMDGAGGHAKHAAGHFRLSALHAGHAAVAVTTLALALSNLSPAASTAKKVEAGLHGMAAAALMTGNPYAAAAGAIVEVGIAIYGAFTKAEEEREKFAVEKTTAMMKGLSEAAANVGKEVSRLFNIEQHQMDREIKNADHAYQQLISTMQEVLAAKIAINDAITEKTNSESDAAATKAARETADENEKQSIKSSQESTALSNKESISAANYSEEVNTNEAEKTEIEKERKKQEEISAKDSRPNAERHGIKTSQSKAAHFASLGVVSDQDKMLARIEEFQNSNFEARSKMLGGISESMRKKPGMALEPSKDDEAFFKGGMEGAKKSALEDKAKGFITYGMADEEAMGPKVKEGEIRARNPNLLMQKKVSEAKAAQEDAKKEVENTVRHGEEAEGKARAAQEKLNKLKLDGEVAAAKRGAEVAVFSSKQEHLKTEQQLAGWSATRKEHERGNAEFEVGAKLERTNDLINSGGRHTEAMRAEDLKAKIIKDAQKLQDGPLHMDAAEAMTRATAQDTADQRLKLIEASKNANVSADSLQSIGGGGGFSSAASLVDLTKETNNWLKQILGAIPYLGGGQFSKFNITEGLVNS